MNEKCEHNSGTVVFTCEAFSIVKCDWECREHLIELNVGNHTVKTRTSEEIMQAEAERKALKGWGEGARLTIKWMKEYLEESFAEHIKYPEYVEFHHYQNICKDLDAWEKVGKK